jgi:hypothetical protein
MIECKLCSEVIPEGYVASADKKMCKKCYSDVVRYRRWQTMTGQIDVYKQSEIHRLETMFKANMAQGKYVPRCFKLPKTPVVCETCSKTFETNTGLKLCYDCNKREQMYIRLLVENGKARGGSAVFVTIVEGKTSKPRKREALHRMDGEYAELHAKGRRVPQAFLRGWA